MLQISTRTQIIMIISLLLISVRCYQGGYSQGVINAVDYLKLQWFILPELYLGIYPGLYHLIRIASFASIFAVYLSIRDDQKNVRGDLLVATGDAPS
jgi:hypothetical protein